jgi:predicted metalloprotease
MPVRYTSEVMDWDKSYESRDVEDRRGQSSGLGGSGGGIGLLIELMLRFGWKGGLVMGALYFGVRYFSGSVTAPGPRQKAGHDEARAFVGYVLDDVQKLWAERLPRYEKAKVVLYSDATATGCGRGEAAVGPFYCPRDERVYLDVTFFRELRQRFGVPGEFAQAYVIAHELGHHVQRLTGTSDLVERAPMRAQRGEGHLSVRLELQADCYAGVWARSAEDRGLIGRGDIDSAMRAAAAVGDDRLQKEAQGTVRPESWTHGSSAERVRWFSRGHDRGSAEACDTFAAKEL